METLLQILLFFAAMDVDWPEAWDDGNYVFTEDDVNNHLAQVVTRVNAARDGLVEVRPIASMGGYGLVAIRDIPRDTQITEYAGTHVHPDSEGPYVAHSADGLTIDGHHGFRATAKGRWVNDPGDVHYRNESEQKKHARWMRKANLYEERLGNGTVWFYAKYNIKKGQELTWYYGPDYDRPWVREVDQDAPERTKRSKIHARCVGCGVSERHAPLYMCGTCQDPARLYCGQRCARK